MCVVILVHISTTRKTIVVYNENDIDAEDWQEYSETEEILRSEQYSLAASWSESESQSSSSADDGYPGSGTTSSNLLSTGHFDEQ